MKEKGSVEDDGQLRCHKCKDVISPLLHHVCRLANDNSLVDRPRRHRFDLSQYAASPEKVSEAMAAHAGAPRRMIDGLWTIPIGTRWIVESAGYPVRVHAGPPTCVLVGEVVSLLAHALGQYDGKLYAALVRLKEEPDLARAIRTMYGLTESLASIRDLMEDPYGEETRGRTEKDK